MHGTIQETVNMGLSYEPPKGGGVSLSLSHTYAQPAVRMVDRTQVGSETADWKLKINGNEPEQTRVDVNPVSLTEVWRDDAKECPEVAGVDLKAVFSRPRFITEETHEMTKHVDYRLEGIRCR